MNMREFIAYLDPIVPSEEFKENLIRVGFELQPLLGISTTSSWKRRREIDGVIIEDHINYYSSHEGGCGRLRHRDPGLARMLNYKVHSLPAMEHRDTTIADANWVEAVKALREDLSGLFKMYDRSQVQLHQF